MRLGPTTRPPMNGPVEVDGPLPAPTSESHSPSSPSLRRPPDRTRMQRLRLRSGRQIALSMNRLPRLTISFSLCRSLSPSLSQSLPQSLSVWEMGEEDKDGDNDEDKDAHSRRVGRASRCFACVTASQSRLPGDRCHQRGAEPRKSSARGRSPRASACWGLGRNARQE